jgi:hypothetical protein
VPIRKKHKTKQKPKLKPERKTQMKKGAVMIWVKWSCSAGLPGSSEESDWVVAQITT